MPSFVVYIRLRRPYRKCPSSLIGRAVTQNAVVVWHIPVVAAELLLLSHERSTLPFDRGDQGLDCPSRRQRVHMEPSHTQTSVPASGQTETHRATGAWSGLVTGITSAAQSCAV